MCIREENKSRKCSPSLPGKPFVSKDLLTLRKVHVETGVRVRTPLPPPSHLEG